MVTFIVEMFLIHSSCMLWPTIINLKVCIYGKLNYTEFRKSNGSTWFMFLGSSVLQHKKQAAHLLDPLLTSKPQAHHGQPAALPGSLLN